MTRATALVVFAVQASVFLNVLALGMRARPRDATYLVRRPGLLLRSLLAMNVIMPAIAVAVSYWVDMPPVVKVALIALAVSPVPPMLWNRDARISASTVYTIGLLATAALLAIVAEPIVIRLIGHVFNQEIHVPVGTIASIAIVSVLAPLALGLVIRHFAPGVAARLTRPLAAAGNIAVLVVGVPILIGAWPSVAPLFGNGSVLLMAAFSAVGLAVGHWLGGPDPDERTVLALATASRHPAIAIAIGNAAFGDPKPVMGMVILYVLVSALVSLPYLKRRARPGAGVGGPVVERALPSRPVQAARRAVP